MNWAVIGIIAEVVSAVAVMITLIFLAVELRANRSSTQSAAIDSLSSGFNSVNALLVEDREFANVYLKGLEDIEQLEETDRLRLVVFLQSWLNHFTSLKKYHDAGVLPQDEWEEYSKAISAVMNTPGGRWVAANAAITPGVREEIRYWQEHGNSYGWLPEQR